MYGFECVALRFGRVSMSKFLSACARAALAACAFAALLASPTIGNATTLTAAQSYGTYTFTQSNAFGTGVFGTVKVSDLGGGVADFLVNVTPNYDLDTGAHHILTFGLVGGTVGSISNAIFSASTGTNIGNPPFGGFNRVIDSSCTQGNPTCRAANGQGFDFHVTGFTGLISGDQFNGQDIFFAADIYQGGCTGDYCTGAVGATQSLQGGNQGSTPLPAALPLFASGVGAVGFLTWRRKQKAQAAAI
jgi:hypothetical protein